MVLDCVLAEGAVLPTYSSDGAAGLDLYSLVDFAISPGEWSIIPTGVALAIPDGFVGLIRGRSGLAARHGLATFAGVIDSDYRGEIGVILFALKGFTAQRGERIAQLLILPVSRASLRIVESLSTTSRGANGFGSTGL